MHENVVLLDSLYTILDIKLYILHLGMYAVLFPSLSTIILRSLSLRLIKHLLVFFYIIIKYCMRSVEPFIFGICMGTYILTIIPSH